MQTIITTDQNGNPISQQSQPIDVQSIINEMNNSYQHAQDLFNHLQTIVALPNISPDVAKVVTPALTAATWATQVANPVSPANPAPAQV